MGKRTSRATGSAGRKVFSASSSSTAKARPKAGAGAAEHYAFRRSKDNGGIDVDANPLDTYSLAVKKHKRSNVSSALTREEEAPGPGGKSRRNADDEADSDDGGIEAGDAVRERLRQLVNSHELQELEAGSDDEELDSDSAFESDEEGFSWGAAFINKAADDEDGEDMEDEPEEGSDDEDVDAEDEDDEDDGDAEMKLSDFISALPTKRKSAPGESDDDEEDSSRVNKRRVLKDRNEEGRKEGSFGAPLNTNSKLSLQALLAPLPAAQSSSLLNSTKALAAPNTGAALPTPLPLRAQDKLDREAAYDATKGEVTKWGAAMKRIKEADHLSFPLQAPKQEKPSAAALTAKFQPKGDFESAVANLISSAQMGDDAAIAKREELAMSNLTLEEVAARRAELRLKRELMFRAETKAKRVAKIKSKSYRKIARKEADRNAEKLAEAGFGEDEDEVRIKKDRDRAIERATLKHKNTGKWAKAMLNKADDLDVDQRRELNEQLEEGDRLKQRIQGRGDGSDSESDSDDEDDEQERDGQVDDGEDGEPREARDNSDELASDSEDSDGPREAFTTVGGNAGRQVWGQGVVQPSNVGRQARAQDFAAEREPTDNPWLTAGASSSKISRKKNAVSGKEASAAEKSAKAFKKSLSKGDAAREREQDDATVDIDPTQVSLPAPKMALDKGKGRAQAQESDEEESEDDHERKGPLALRQRDLVAQAFAGDNVLEDFAEEKRKEEDRDKPQEVDTTLPGWGSWGGRGIKKQKPKKQNIKHVPGVDVSKRKDFKKSHVIISEKKDKKATKHMTKDLPYPYTSAAQYEASLRTAVGPEWSTRATVQKATMPRVVTKMGTIIHPLQKQW